MPFVPEVTCLATMAARSATAGTTAAMPIQPNSQWRGATFELDIDAVATGLAGTRLDVYVETTIDGSNWFKVVHFPQVATATTANGIQRYEQVWGAIGCAGFTSTEAAPAAGVVKAFIGAQWRVAWVRNKATATLSYTFAVYAF